MSSISSLSTLQTEVDGISVCSDVTAKVGVPFPPSGDDLEDVVVLSSPIPEDVMAAVSVV